MLTKGIRAKLLVQEPQVDLPPKMTTLLKVGSPKTGTCFGYSGPLLLGMTRVRPTSDENLKGRAGNSGYFHDYFTVILETKTFILIGFRATAKFGKK